MIIKTVGDLILELYKYRPDQPIELVDGSKLWVVVDDGDVFITGVTYPATKDEVQENE